MKNWFAWLQQVLHRNKLPQWLIISGFCLALIGFADASYLTLKRLQGITPPCILASGCDAVTRSSYSTFGPIPVSMVGAFYYFVVLVLFLLTIDSKNERWAVLALHIAPFGFLFSTYFLLIQALVINAYCTYCLVSIATSYSIFGLAVYAKTKKII